MPVLKPELNFKDPFIFKFRVELTSVLATVLCAVAGVATFTSVFTLVFYWEHCHRNNGVDNKTTEVNIFYLSNRGNNRVL
ncbi:unnamed protein product [Euphydryas editha]|uniref:Uncharacterized protein n=1 Tax=Euphydryas editha TaxID=104508 RepID=A0AAU9UPB4_EUPED|nr:unnamed protein product [Euphydryas editha]